MVRLGTAFVKEGVGSSEAVGSVVQECACRQCRTGMGDIASRAARLPVGTVGARPDGNPWPLT